MGNELQGSFISSGASLSRSIPHTQCTRIYSMHQQTHTQAQQRAAAATTTVFDWVYCDKLDDSIACCVGNNYL